jgi:hypothetical protein
LGRYYYSDRVRRHNGCGLNAVQGIERGLAAEAHKAKPLVAFGAFAVRFYRECSGEKPVFMRRGAFLYPWSVV